MTAGEGRKRVKTVIQNTDKKQTRPTVKNTPVKKPKKK